MAVGVSTYKGPVSVARAAPPPVRRQGDDPSSPASAGHYVPVALDLITWGLYRHTCTLYSLVML